MVLSSGVSAPPFRYLWMLLGVVSLSDITSAACGCLRHDPTNQVTHHGCGRHRQSASHENSYGCAQYRRTPGSGPSDTKRREGNESAYHHRCRPSTGRDQQEGGNRQHGTSREAQRRIDRRLDGASQDGSHAEVVTGVRAERVGSRESIGDLAGQLLGKPTFDIDGGQFLLLDVWMRLELSSLLVEVSSLNISLRADRYVLARSHRHGSGDQCGCGRR